MRSRCAKSVVGVIVSLGAAGTAAGQIEYRTVATQGSAAPGGGIYGDFGAAVMGPDGSIAVPNNVLSVPAAMSSRLFLERDGRLALLAGEGMPAPGTAPGETYSEDGLLSLATPRFADDGTFYFATLLQGGSVTTANDQGLWIEDGAAVNLVLREGDDLSVLFPGVTLGPVDPTPIDATRTLVRASLVGGDITAADDELILLIDAGVLSVLFREGDPAPGFDPGVNFLQIPAPQTMGAGGIIGVGRLTGEGISSSNDAVLYGGTVGSPMVLLQEGDAAPGLREGAVFRTFDTAVISAGGTRAVDARVGTDFRESIWVFKGSTPELVVDVASTPVPGLAAGAAFSSLSRLQVDDSGAVTFTARFSGPGVTDDDNSGIFRFAADGTGTLLAREGSNAPGASAGDVFTDLFNLTSFGMSALGQVVFDGQLTGPNITIDNDRGLWMTDADGDVQLVVRDGDLFDINDDPNGQTLRTIRTISFGRRSPTDQGEIAFTLRYTTFETGVFTATIEPPVGGIDCPSDVTGDGATDLADLNLVLANFGVATTDGDATGDGMVDLADLNLVLAAFGTVCE